MMMIFKKRAYLFYVVLGNLVPLSCMALENEGNLNIDFIMEKSSGGIRDLELISKCFKNVRTEAESKGLSLSKLSLTLAQFMTADQMRSSKSTDVISSLKTAKVDELLAKKKGMVRIVFSTDKVLPGGTIVFFCDSETGEVILTHQSR